MAVAAPPRTNARLLTPVARGWALGIGSVAAAVALALAAVFAGDRGTVPAFDAHVMVRIYADYPDRRTWAHRIADLGGSVAVFLIVVAIVVWCYTQQRLRGVALAIIGPTLAIVVTEYVLKPTVDRRLLGYVTYPSGHATGAFSVATVMAVLLVGENLRLRAATRVAAVVVVFAICALVAVSLVAAGYHVPTDTIGGAGVAIAAVLFVAVLIDAVAERRLTRR